MRAVLAAGAVLAWATLVACSTDEEVSSPPPVVFNQPPPQWSGEGTEAPVSLDGSNVVVQRRDASSDADADARFDGRPADASEAAADVAAEADAPSALGFGAPCISHVQCASALCLAFGRCSTACDPTASPCPSAGPWVCAAIPSLGQRCTCGGSEAECTFGVDASTDANTDASDASDASDAAKDG